MPVVQMPDGTLVDMPDKLTERQASGLKALVERSRGQKAPVEAPLYAPDGHTVTQVPEAKPQQPQQSRAGKEWDETWRPELGPSKETISRMEEAPLIGKFNQLTEPVWKPTATGADLVGRLMGMPVSAAVADLAERFGMDHTQADRLYRDLRIVVMGAGIEAGRAPEAQVTKMKTGLGEKVGQATDKAIETWFDRDPEAAKIALQLAQEGRPVAPGGYLGSAKRMQFGIELARKFGYDPTAKAEALLTEDRVRDMLGKVGMSGQEVDGVVAEMKKPQGSEYHQTADAIKSQLEKERSDTHAAVLNKAQEIRSEAQATGKAAVDALESQKADLSKGQARNAAQAQKMVDEGWRKVEELKKRPGNVAEDLEKEVTGLKAETQRAASELYDWADQAAGGARVDTRKGAQAAKALLEEMPKKVDDLGMAGDANAPASVRKALNAMSAGSMTFGELHRLRSELRALGQQHDLASSLGKGTVKYVASVVDDLLASSSKSMKSDARLAEASKLLDQADSFYAQNMQRFKDHGLRQVVDNLKSGIAPDPETVAKQIMHSGNSGLRQELLSIAGRKPGLVERIRNADFQSMMKEARDGLTGELDTGKLASMVEDRVKSGVLKDFYGESHAKTLQTLSRRLQQQTGKVSLDVGPQDNFVRALSAANDKAAKLKDLAKQDPIRLMEQAVAEGEGRVKDLMARAQASDKLDPLSGLRSASSDAAARELINKPELLKQAIGRWGEDHKAIQLLREEAARNILSPVLRGEGAGSVIDGMASLPKASKEMLFPKGLGNDLEALVKELRVMRGAPVGGMAGMSAGQAFGGGLKSYLAKAAAKVLLSQTVTNPRFVRVLAGELRSNPQMARSKLLRLAEGVGVANLEEASKDHSKQEAPLPDHPPSPKSDWHTSLRNKGPRRWQSELSR